MAAGRAARHVDVTLALGLAVVTLLSRWPYRARMLYNWDAVQFALALREFDIAKHQPHPPGYLLYVALGACSTPPSRIPRSPTWRSRCCSAPAAPSCSTISRAVSTTAPPRWWRRRCWR